MIRLNKAYSKLFVKFYNELNRDFINKLTICTQIQKNKEILVNWVLTKSGMYTNKNCQEDIKKNEQVSCLEIEIYIKNEIEKLINMVLGTPCMVDKYEIEKKRDDYISNINKVRTKLKLKEFTKPNGEYTLWFKKRRWEHK